MLLFRSAPQTEHPVSLCNGVREAMLKRDCGKALLVVEGMYFLKLDPDAWLTFDQIYRLLHANFGMSRQVVYYGLQASDIFQRRKDTGRAHRRGPKPYLYRVPHPIELEAMFAPLGTSTPSDQLKRTDLCNLKAYRMALHREMVIRNWLDAGGKGFKMYRGLMADRLHVSVRTVRTYEKDLGFSNEANYRERQITWDNWYRLPRYKQQFSPEGERLPSKQWLKIVDWRTGTVILKPHVRYLAYTAMKEGLEVYQVERLANTYYPYQGLRPLLNLPI